MKLSIFVFCVLLEVTLGKAPQVYEDVDDQVQVESNTRVARQSLNQQKIQYIPQTFKFGKAVQQDQRHNRYIQQQKVDIQNILARSKLAKPEVSLKLSLTQDSKAGNPTVTSSTTVKPNDQLPQEKTNSSVWDKVSQLSIRRHVNSRKMKPTSYFEDNIEEKVKRQDNSKVVYVNPDLMKDKRSDYDLNALNALVGQPASTQLEGLKRLLGDSSSGIVLPPIKGPLPRPITEPVEDIPNPNTHPNVDTTFSLEAIQAQLDAAAKVQLAKALADAQKQAKAHVEAQHKAIAKVQEEAKKKALAEIARHNQRLKNVEITIPSNGVKEKSHLAPIPTSSTITKEHKLPTPLPLKQAVLPTRQYSTTHSHQHYIQELVTPLSTNSPKKITVTKPHPVAQKQESPSTYQQAVLETQQHSHKVSPGINQLETIDDDENHQYAARYAFGYKIRDAKMRNEFGHEEKRDGENAKGLYHVLLPDGRMQKVEYFVDPSGYHAKVTYENLAHH